MCVCCTLHLFLHFTLPFNVVCVSVFDRLWNLKHESVNVAEQHALWQPLYVIGKHGCYMHI